MYDFPPASQTRVRITFEQCGSVLCFRLLGDDSLDSTNSAEVKHAVVSEITGEVDLVIDLSAVRFIDSSGVGALVSVLKKARSRGRRMILAGVTPPVRSILEVIRLTAVFELRDTVEEALALLEGR